MGRQSSEMWEVLSPSTLLVCLPFICVMLTSQPVQLFRKQKQIQLSMCSVCKPCDAPFIYCFCHKAGAGSSASGSASGECGLAFSTHTSPAVGLGPPSGPRCLDCALRSPDSLGWFWAPGRVDLGNVRPHSSEQGFSGPLLC